MYFTCRKASPSSLCPSCLHYDCALGGFLLSSGAVSEHNWVLEGDLTASQWRGHQLLSYMSHITPSSGPTGHASHRGCGSAVETIFFVSWLFCLTLAPLSMSLCLCFFSLLFALTLTFLSRLSPPQKKRVSSATCLLLIPYSKRVHACPVCMQRREYECTHRRCECSSAVCYDVLKSTDLVWCKTSDAWEQSTALQTVMV